MKVYIGYDPNEQEAFRVAESSLRRLSRTNHEVIRLSAPRLRQAGIVTRPVDARDGLYDLGSNAPMATEFAITRFAVPLLAHSGWALFLDCDMLFMEDVNEIMRYADATKAVCVVKHDHKPKEETKMMGAAQTVYARKNWSSVILWNCDHPANRRLTLDMINNWPGRDLHGFGWLADSEIGELPREWNWLVGVQEKPAQPAIAHYTLGGPWFAGWPGAEHDELWLAEAAR